jgi:xylan 1,4-beta-xylosidase
MFSKMSGQTVAVQSDHAEPLDAMLRQGVRERPDVTALASLDKSRLCVLVWHYHDDDVPRPAAEVELAVTGLPSQASESRVTHFRIDEDHSNSFSAWKRMGSPPQPTAEQYAQLERAAQLAALPEPATVGVASGEARLRIQLPRQAVSLIVLDWGTG